MIRSDQGTRWGPSFASQGQAEVARGERSPVVGRVLQRVRCCARQHKWMHSGVGNANDRSANVRTVWSVFLQRRSYSTAKICRGSGQREQKQGAQGEEGQRHRRKKG